jgi:hypothetical protein
MSNRNFTPATQTFYGVKNMIQESGAIGPTGPMGPTGPSGSGTTGGGASSLNDLTDASYTLTDDVYQLYIGQKVPETISNEANILAIGKNTLQLNIDGENNISLGHNSLQNNTEGSQNIAIGHYALHNNTYSSQNVAIGNYTLHYNTVGGRNTAIGYQCMEQNITGSYNTAMGRRALESLTNGESNTVIGYRALQNMIEGSKNTFIGSYTSTGYDPEMGMDRQINNAIAIGYQATANITGGLFFPGSSTGEDSLSLAEVDSDGAIRPVIYNLETGQMGPISSTGTIGKLSILSDCKNILYEGEGTFSQALSVGSTLSDTIRNGEYDTSSLKVLAVGYDALRNNTTGTRNIAVGGDALRSNTIGGNNIAVGVRSLDTCSGNNNVAIGDSALTFIYEGSNNVAIGNSSLTNLEFSNNNTAIGALTSVTSGVSDCIVIGNRATANITGGLFFPGTDNEGVPIAPVVGNNLLNVAYNPESGQLGTRSAIHTRYSSSDPPPDGSVTASVDPVYPRNLPPNTFSVFVIDDDGTSDTRQFFFNVQNGQRAELLILNNDTSGPQIVTITKDEEGNPALMSKTISYQHCCYCNIVGNLIAYMDERNHGLG